MTHLETERLVRKISELLQNGGNTDIASKLAGDYASACHATNIRLQQCEAMIKAGDRHQAIQLAETAPNLLDVVTVLEFRNADEWRLFCQKQSLPVPDRIDARAVQELNGCYAEGIATDHPLYAAYRKAVLSRNDEEALKALQSITRLNPNDGNAASELARLDAKVLSLKLNNLGGLLTGGDSALVLSAVDAIEAFGFKSKPDGEVWSKAMVIRCSKLVEQAAKLKSESQWLEVLAKLDFVKRLRGELKLEMPSSQVKTMGELEVWGKGEQDKDRKEREFNSLLSELQYRIQQSEEKDTSARYVKLPELCQDSEGLHKVWRSLADFTRPIPENATAAFRKRSGLIDAEIARRTTIRFRIILASSATALVVGGVIIWLFMGQMKANDYVKQLRAAVSDHQARSAMQLIERLQTSEKSLLNVGSVNAALATAETFVSQQRTLLANFESEFAKLPTKLDGAPDSLQINAIADQLLLVRAALNGLAPDLKQENEARVTLFEQQWQQYLSEGGTIVNGTFEQWITSAETHCGQLNYRAPIETAKAQLSNLSDEIQKINDCETGFKNHVNLRSDLLQRATAVRTIFAAYEVELNKIDEGIAAMTNAASFQDYSSGLSRVASSEFSGAPIVADAILVQSLNPNEEFTLRLLLNATNSATWAFINKSRAADFIPNIAMPSEVQGFQRLYANPAVNAAHHHYHLYSGSDNAISVDWITAGALDTTEGWKKIAAWTVSSNDSNAVFDDHDYGYFGGQLKLSPTQPIYNLEDIIESDPTTAFASIGLEKVSRPDSSYGGSLLEVLDHINGSHDGSPVFRAHLFCCLVALMDFQPDAWGLSFSPSVRAEVKRIQEITGGPIRSGDWFISQKVGDWGPKLEDCFNSDKAISFTKQATACLTISRAIAKDGLHYVGFVGLDGKPIFLEETAPVEIWCYTAASKIPVLLSRAALPLSPLFALPSLRTEYISKTGINTDSPGISNALPPMFRAAQ